MGNEAFRSSIESGNDFFRAKKVAPVDLRGAFGGGRKPELSIVRPQPICRRRSQLTRQHDARVSGGCIRG